MQLIMTPALHLNAGTSLKYPVKFIEGKNRQVFLKGEANFSVTKNENHPFIVNADSSKSFGSTILVFSKNLFD